jgi:glycosyltransferase involved in cell wall biosynthesis
VKILIQMGNKGDSIIEHLISPIARVAAVDEIILVTNKPGPQIDKVKYYYPPKCFRKVPIITVKIEAILLFALALFKNPQIIAGYLLFPHGLLAYIVAKITRKPVIISLIAGPVELYSPGSPSSYNLNDSLRLYGKTMMSILKNANAVVTTGIFTKDFLVKHGIPADKVFPIISCPNTSKFYPTESNIEYDVVFVGRLAPVKNVETVLYALKEVKKKMQNIKACIVGDGPLRINLEELTANLGLENNVYFAGFQKDVASFLSKSRVFILSSKREGFPNVYLEALYCGLPAAVSNCGDIISIAKNDYNSFVIEDHKDYQSFSEAIVELLTDSIKYDQMKNNTIATAIELNPENNTKEWANILKAVSDSK